jgi:hypothetical protein
MIEKLNEVTVTDFNKETLKILKPYFDAGADTDQLDLWFENLLTLASHSLGIAHCIQHNHGARLAMFMAFADRPLPSFFQPDYEKQIGSYSNRKGADSMVITGNQISGTKHWISNLHQADYGIYTLPVDITLEDPTEAFVLFDLTSGEHQIDPTTITPLGMEVARAGSLITNNYNIPEHYLLWQRQYYVNNKSPFTFISSWMDYSFITNYLGCIIGLFNDLTAYTRDRKINVDHELRKIGLSISSLKMMWDDNLDSVAQSKNSDNITDAYWHRRNTQYTQSKNILLSLINLVLQVADSRWMDSFGAGNQRFRDALVFSTHMKPLYKNLEEKHFVRL